MRAMFRNVDHAIRFAFAMQEIPIGNFCCLSNLTIGRDRDGKRVCELLPGGHAEMTSHDMHAQAGLIWTRLFGSVQDGKRVGGLPEPLRSFVNVQYGWGAPRSVSINYLAPKTAAHYGLECTRELADALLVQASGRLRGINVPTRRSVTGEHKLTPDKLRWLESKFRDRLIDLHNQLDWMLAPEWAAAGLIDSESTCAA